MIIFETLQVKYIFHKSLSSQYSILKSIMKVLNILSEWNRNPFKKYLYLNIEVKLL